MIIAGALLFSGTSKVFALLVSFSAFGYILSYYMPILALAYRRWRSKWTLENAWAQRSIGAITGVAVVWLTAEIINLVWPRSVTDSWYLNWGVIISTALLGVVGALISWWVFRPGSPAAEASQQAKATLDREDA